MVWNDEIIVILLACVGLCAKSDYDFEWKIQDFIYIKVNLENMYF